MASEGTLRGLVARYFKERPWIIAMYLALALFYPMRVVAVPYFMGKLTTKINEPAEKMQWPAIKRLIILIASMWVASLLLQVGHGVFDSHFGPRFGNHMRSSAIEAILHSYRRNYRELDAGDINVKLYRLPESVMSEFKYLVSNLLPVVMVLIVAAVFFFKTHRVLGFVFLGFVGMVVLLYVAMTLVLIRTFRAASQNLDHLHEEVDDFMTNLLALYVSDTVDMETERLKTTNERVRQLWTRVYLQKTAFRAISTFLKYGFLAVMIMVSVWLRNRAELLDVAPVLFMTFTLDSVLYDAIITHINMLFYSADINKMERFLADVSRCVVSAPDRRRLRDLAADGRIVYDSVSVTHAGCATPTLDRVSLAVNSGDRVLITGRIGSGKSTLTRLLAGLHPYAGSLRVGGFEVRDMSAVEIGRAVTYIPQAPRLFNRTLLENILYGLGDALGRADVEKVLDALAIPDFPSLDTVVGKGGSGLSGGQRTIVYLVRAFLRKTPVVVLDEPTAALDDATKEIVKQAVDALFDGRTVLVITHDASVDWNPTQHWVVNDHAVTVK